MERAGETPCSPLPARALSALLVVTGSLAPPAVDAGSLVPASGLCGAGASAIRLKDETCAPAGEIEPEPGGLEEPALGEGATSDWEAGVGEGESVGNGGGVPVALGGGRDVPGESAPAAIAPMIAIPVGDPLAAGVVPADEARPLAGGTVVPAAADGDGDAPAPADGFVSVCAAGDGVEGDIADGTEGGAVAVAEAAPGVVAVTDTAGPA